MWLAVGDPSQPRWKHAGIAKRFTQGRWQQNQAPLPRDLRKAMETLYKYRLKADYHGRPVTQNEAQEGVATAEQVLSMVARELVLPQSGLLP